MPVGGSLDPQRARQNKAQVETGKPANHRRHQVRERIQEFVPLQHRVQFHDESRQCRETAAKADCK